MEHIKIEQNSNVEVVDSNIIHKLAEEAQDCDASSNMTGNLQTTKAYKRDVDFLTAKFPGLTINATQGLYVDVRDRFFEQLLLSSGIGDSTGITTTDAATVTDISGITPNVTNDVDVIDLRIFPNLVFWPSGGSANQLIDNVHLKELNFGNIQKLTPMGSTLMQGNFNIRIANGLVVDKCVGENVELIGVFELRSFLPKELYLPNVKCMGQATGNIAEAHDMDGQSTTYLREFAFLGDKLELWAGLNDNNAEQYRFTCKIVITAPVPPQWVEWAFGADVDTYTPKSYAKYAMGSYCYYVPDAALNDYKQAAIWSNIWNDWGTECLKPISELPIEYKQKISKWYTEPSND